MTITLFSLKSVGEPLILSVSILTVSTVTVDRSAHANLGDPGLLPELALTT